MPYITVTRNLKKSNTNFEYIKKADKLTFMSLLDDLFKTKDIVRLGPKISDFLTKYFGIYLSGLLMKEIIKERHSILGTRDLGDFDSNLIQGIVNNPLLWNSYQNVGIDVTNKINKILSLGLEQNKLPKVIRNEILDQVKEITKSRAELIIRNETQNVRNIAREQSYLELDPNQERLYFMQGPDDNRTAESTKRVAARIGKGKKLDEVKQIIREEGDQRTYREDRPFTIHLNGRRKLAFAIDI